MYKQTEEVSEALKENVRNGIAGLNLSISESGKEDIWRAG